MLATVIRFLLAQTFITEFMVWLSIAFVIIAGRPIRAICAEVPGVGTRFLFAPSASHFIPPYNSRDNDYSTIPVNVKPLSNRRWWGRIRVWIGCLLHHHQFGNGLVLSLASLHWGLRW